MRGYTTSASLADDTEFDIERVKGLFEDAFDQIWSGRIENDDFNRLVLRAHLSAREVTIPRVCEVPAASRLDLQRRVYRAR